MNGARCALRYDISRTNPDEKQEMEAISLPTIPFAWSPDIHTVLGICVAAHLHRLGSYPGSQTKAEEASNAPCSTYYHNAVLDIHGDRRAALRLKTLTEHFRDENLEFLPSLFGAAAK